MPRKKVPSKRRPATVRRAARKRPASRTRPEPSSVLILECDASKLARQGIRVASELLGVLRLCSVPTCLVQVDCERDLVDGRADALAQHRHYDVVVIVAHSNVSGLRLHSRNGDADWDAVARWLRPFRPRSIALVACEAGRWLPSKALFEGLTDLTEIYGSPVPTTADEVGAVKFLVPHLALAGRPTTELVRFGQALNFIATGGVIFQQTREDFERGDSSEGVAWTGFEAILRQILPDLRSLIGR